ncbi:MAG: phosphotransacetylase [bacterium]
MSDALEVLKKRAKERPVKIIFPEGDDERVVQAAKALAEEKLAIPVLVRQDSISGIECLHPGRDKNQAELINKFFEKNKKRVVSKDEASETLENPLYYAAMKLGNGDVAGFVGGCANSTAETVKALLRCVGIRKSPGENFKHLLSSCFMMLLKDRNFLFADCAIIPEPAADQLATIAIQTARSCRLFLGSEPKVALLSFSTLGSAELNPVLKVSEANAILKKSGVDFEFFGEIQADAAIVPQIALKKTNGKWGGDANVLIFPDLNSGNISYKLVERLAGAVAIGPILQGLMKPGNDLSRGCSKYDIINAAIITAVQSRMDATLPQP